MTKDYRKKIVISSFWVIGVYGISQLVRFGANLITTRLLSPELFGVMSLITVLVQGLAMLTDVGLWSNIVRSKEGTQPYFYNTVWTLQVARNWTIFLIIVACCLAFIYVRDVIGVPMNGVYQNQLLPIVMIVVGAGNLINAHKSMAAAIVSRGFERGRIELNSLLAQLSGISVMLCWAWYSPSIWALASASVVSSIIAALLTYTVFPYRHRFTMDKRVVEEVMTFGKWIMISSVLTFLCNQGDRLFFANYLSAYELGIYSVAYFLANTITTIIQQLSTKIWFPVFSKTVQQNRQNLFKTYYRVRLIQDAASFFVSGFLFVAGSFVVSSLYDARYEQAGWMLEYFAISIAPTSILCLGQECLSALGISKIRSMIMLIRSLGLIVGLPLAYSKFGIPGAILVVSFNSWLGIPILYFTLYKHGLFSLIRELRLLPIAIVGFFLGKAFINYFTQLSESLF